MPVAIIELMLSSVVCVLTPVRSTKYTVVMETRTKLSVRTRSHTRPIVEVVITAKTEIASANKKNE